VVRALTRRGLATVASLAVVAGYVDGFAFVYLGGYFVSFMSGNTTRAGAGLASGDFAAVGFGALLIASFVAGAMVGTAVSRPARDRSVVVLAIVAVALAAAAASAGAGMPPWAAALLAFGMGAVNTAFADGGEVSFGITYMTGALVKVGQGIVIALRGGDRTGWIRHLVLWVSIAIGAVAGAAAHQLWGAVALWVAVVWVLAVVLVRFGSARARR